MDAVIAQRGSQVEPMRSLAAPPPSKLKMLGFAVLVIVVVGALVAAAIGLLSLTVQQQSPWLAHVAKVLGNDGCWGLLIGGLVVDMSALMLAYFILQKTPLIEQPQPIQHNAEPLKENTNKKNTLRLEPEALITHITAYEVPPREIKPSEAADRLPNLHYTYIFHPTADLLDLISKGNNGGFRIQENITREEYENTERAALKAYNYTYISLQDLKLYSYKV